MNYIERKKFYIYILVISNFDLMFVGLINDVCVF